MLRHTRQAASISRLKYMQLLRDAVTYTSCTYVYNLCIIVSCVLWAPLHTQ